MCICILPINTNFSKCVCTTKILLLDEILFFSSVLYPCKCAVKIDLCVLCSMKTTKNINSNKLTTLNEWYKFIPHSDGFLVFQKFRVMFLTKGIVWVHIFFQVGTICDWKSLLLYFLGWHFVYFTIILAFSMSFCAISTYWYVMF